MTDTTSSGKATVTLQGDREILITREFDAPRSLVWRAITEPELIKRWWHANRGVVDSAEVDLRPGGRWRYLGHSEGGQQVAFRGEYSEVVPEERLVTTEIYEVPGVPDEQLEAMAAVNTLTLTEQDGRTTMTVHVRHAAPEHRDMHIGSGMEAGMQSAYDLLEEVAKSLA